MAFKGYGCTVTHSQFKSPRKTYLLADITRTSLKLTHAFVLLPLHIGILSLIYSSADLLYPMEILAGLTFVLVVGGLSFSVGIISVTGQYNLQGIAAIGLYWHMREVKDALDTAMERTQRRRSRG